MDKEQIKRSVGYYICLLDICMIGIEGKPRQYTDISPTISARDYKDPRWVLEVAENE